MSCPTRGNSWETIATPAAWLAIGEPVASSSPLIDTSPPGIRGHRARQDAEQGRLPGPVLADKADDLTEREDQVLDLQHGGKSVRLRHVVQGNAVGVALHPVLHWRICHWAEIPMLLQKLAKSLSFALVMMPTPVLRTLPGPGTKYGLTRAIVALSPRALSAAST